MTQLQELRAVATRWRAANQDHVGGIVMVCDGRVYGWKNELRDPESERPGVYAVDSSGVVFRAVGGDEYNGAEAWIAVDPDGQ
ncbi:antirestriction protein ArdR [Pseudomonas mosselii]|uniref:antirestriction protein ArdR n=1 Tax=Pseudomonas mosselii TaxID=78327 RepID=UPI0021D88196|nr:antirestriction protein ArdR [Pseudomonas mosselii]MCU9529335.1 antirestriction protein ArdR [Pseudomonas mosselii]MCU9536626.1 antirestriction protein ArdR [Pseudomonas mosselii]MCU9542246.1 antirestriction protein ArdR [Pseudomonas mosselii]MCU9548351.1 antirestriction protein ArdR [Pseudomonas mosselii]